MLKSSIILLAVFFVSATNTSCTGKQLENYRLMVETEKIDEAKTYIATQYDNAVKKYIKLKDDATAQSILVIPKGFPDILAARINDEIKSLQNGTVHNNDMKCMMYETDVVRKAHEAFNNFTKCITHSLDNPGVYFRFIDADKDRLFQEVEEFRKKSNSCVNENKSDVDEAEQCLVHVGKAVVQVRAEIDHRIDFHLPKLKYMYKHIDEPLSSCNYKYGVENAMKIAKVIAARITDCLNKNN